MPSSPVDRPAVRSVAYSWRELVGMVLSHRRELILANIIAIFGALVSVPVPLLIPLLVDEVLLDKPGQLVALVNPLLPADWQQPVAYILAILCLTLLLRFLTLVFEVWQVRQFTCIAKDVIFRIRRELLQRLERFSMAEYETLGSSTVASHLVTDLDTVDAFVSTTISKFIVAVLSVVGTALVLLWLHWQLALFILLLNPLVIYITTLFGRKVKALKQRENRAYQAFQETLAETLDAIQQIRASNREHHFIQRIIDRAAAIRRDSASFTWKEEAANRMAFIVFLFGFDIFRALAMLAVLFSGLSIGEMIAVGAYLWFMVTPVQQILSMQLAHSGARAALDRINALMDVHLEPEYPHLENPFENRDTVSITLRDICFAYGDGPLLLDHLNLHIPAGQKVALVGASGGGKTTLVQVLLGLYIPTSGEIYYEGSPVSRIGLDVVRDHVATVLQHPALFNDSVRMNLTLGKPIDDAELWQALEIAQLADTIRALPRGLDTPIGRDGIRLSGGQRQRLAIARMVLSRPSVVILDEATSALDSDTEHRLHQALESFLKHRTTLIVAHRLSAVRQAERVLVFEDGRIVEDGAHEHLIESDGLYAHLYRRQEPGGR